MKDNTVKMFENLFKEASDIATALNKDEEVDTGAGIGVLCIAMQNDEILLNYNTYYEEFLQMVVGALIQISYNNDISINDMKKSLNDMIDTYKNTVELKRDDTNGLIH